MSEFVPITCMTCGKLMFVGLTSSAERTEFILFCDRTKGCEQNGTRNVPLSFNLA